MSGEFKDKKLTFNEAQGIINIVKKIDLKREAVTADVIKELIKPLWVGRTKRFPILKPGEIFYRGRSSLEITS